MQTASLPFLFSSKHHQIDYEEEEEEEEEESCTMTSNICGIFCAAEEVS